jgi:large subunit ribosomal protein L5
MTDEQAPQTPPAKAEEEKVEAVEEKKVAKESGDSVFPQGSNLKDSAGVIDYNPMAEEQKKIIEKREKDRKPKPPVIKKNPMRNIVIDKIVINVGVGEAGERLQRAQKAIELLIKNDQKTIQTISNTTNKDLGIRKLMPIGCKVTLRGKDATDFLKRAMWVKESKIASYSFDPEGNFSFGIPDYTSFENMRYNPDIGIFGLDICVTLRRAGYRIKKRKQKNKKVPKYHRISREEGIAFAKKELGAEVVI